MVYFTGRCGHLPKSVGYAAQHMQKPVPFHISPLVMLASMIPCDAGNQPFTQNQEDSGPKNQPQPAYCFLLGDTGLGLSCRGCFIFHFLCTADFLAIPVLKDTEL